MKDIHLYINEQEVDLGDDSLVLYNWAETDFSNPSTTQNSFSKVITLQGTKRNNRVFGNLWNVEHIQTYNGELNASRRIPFRITFDGGNVFEEGYCKLQNIKLNKGVYQYEISLFGMIGNFLNNLATNYSDGSVKTLADLHYYFQGQEKEELDLDFNINISAVTEAWQHLGWDETKWSVINFANCYNGIPQNMDADKVLIDGVKAYGPFLTSATTEEGTNYETANDRVIVKTQNKMTKDEVKDIRSYLLTPVVSCKKVIQAICDKGNNAGQYDSGFDVELDQDFFTWTNPYYENTWMTLPQITSLKITNTSKDNTETTITGMSFFKKEIYGSKDQQRRFIYNIELPETLKDWKTFEIRLQFGISIQHPSYNGEYYLRERNDLLLNGYGIQAYAISDDAGSNYENILNGSNFIWLTSDSDSFPWNVVNPKAPKIPYSKAISLGYQPKYPDATITSYDTTKWVKGEGVVYHTLVFNNNSDIVLTMSAPIGTRNIRICFDMFAAGTKWPSNNITPPYGLPVGMYTIENFYNYYLNCEYKGESGYYSNKLITKQNLLTTNYSVKDWLLSYCKLFGLYIWFDLVTNKIHIDTRKNFYKRNNVVNISDRIDLTKDYAIKPVFAETKFYNLTTEQVSTDLAEDYKNIYGKVYGMKSIDTGVDLALEPKELLDLKYKSAIMTNKQSLYNYLPSTVDNVSGITPYLCDGISYNLYKDGDFSENSETKEITKDSYVIQQVFNGRELLSGKTYYDLYDKPLFEKDSKVADSANVLLFQNNWAYLSGTGFYLSDDLPIMTDMNGKPTWIVTKDFTGKDYVKEVEYAPMFSRYWIEGQHVLFSLDFGSPRQLYIDDTINHEEATLYNRYYKTYYEDLFDVNTKTVNCYYLPKNVLSLNDIRRFYWFDNSVWRLNKIVDYNPEKPELVKVEFVKVQDRENMNSVTPSIVLTVTVKLDSYTIGCKGGTIKGTVICSDFGPWTVELDSGMFVTPASAATNSDIILDIPANITTEQERNLGITAGDVGTFVTVTQEGGAGQIATIPITVNNLYSEPIRLGMLLFPFDDYPYTYRTIPSGESVTYALPIPYNGTAWNYDLLLEDVYGNFETEKFTLTLSDSTTIVEYDLADLMEQAENIGAQKLNGATLTIEQA